MSRKSWGSTKSGAIRLGGTKPSDAADVPQRKIHAVPKAALEEGILQLLASAAEMQQRQDLDSARQLYAAAMEKVKAHNLNRKRLFTGTTKKPPPLNSRTPLQWCLHVGDIESAICLLGSPNAALAELRTAVAIERIEQVLDAGADVECRIGLMGRTLLLQETVDGRLTGVRLALERGASVSVMDDNGDTALALALQCRESQAPLIITALIEAGAEINSRDGKGQPLLKLALAQGQPDVVAKVIDALSPLTPGHRDCMRSWAVNLRPDTKWSNRTLEVLRMLVAHDLDPNLQLKSNSNCTLLRSAVRQQAPTSELLVESLLDHGATPDLGAALESGTGRVIDLMLKQVKPLQDDQYQQIIGWLDTLHLNPGQWSQRDWALIKALLDQGLSPDLRRLSSPHSPLIVCAASAGDIALVQKLISLKAQLNVADDNSDTALICAAKISNRPIYDTLRDAGVNDKLFFGLTTVWNSHQRVS